jgi:hypothetical protein
MRLVHLRLFQAKPDIRVYMLNEDGEEIKQLIMLTHHLDWDDPNTTAPDGDE